MDYPCGKFGVIVVPAVVVHKQIHTHTDTDERFTPAILVTNCQLQ